MSRIGFTEHVVVTRLPSRIMLGFLLVTHLLALASLVLSNLGSGLCVFLSLAISCHGYQACRQFWLLSGKDVVRTLVHHDNSWLLILADGRQVEVELTGDMVVLEWLVALRFQDQDRSYQVILWSDSAHADELRHLRVWLRLNASQLVAG